MRASGSRATHTTVLGCACEGPGGIRQCGLAPVAKARHNQCGWPMPRSVVPLATVRGTHAMIRVARARFWVADAAARGCGPHDGVVWRAARIRAWARPVWQSGATPAWDGPCLGPGGPCERPRGQCDGLGGPDSLRRPSGLFTTYRLLACDAVALRTCGWRLTRFRAVPGLSRPTAAPAAAPQPELLRHDPRLLLQRSEVVPLRS
jgi:hypothetical protein